MLEIPAVSAFRSVEVLPIGLIKDEEHQSKKPVLRKTKASCVSQAKELFLFPTRTTFGRKLKSLTAITPYSNAVQLQFSNKTYTVLVSDVQSVSYLISLINNT